MTFVHGKNTVVLINNGTSDINISAYTNSTEESDTQETAENTCYGQTRKTYNSGLGDGEISIKGVHNDGVNNPRAVLKAIKAAQEAGTLDAVNFTFRPEGTGSGKAQSIVAVLVTEYKQSSPVSGNSMWEAKLQMSGTVNETDQT
jgi:hypothetical protein